MTERPAPPKPPNSFRLTLVLDEPKERVDQVLMEELRKQDRNAELKRISRNGFKELFKNKKVQIKGQIAKPSSALAQGTTHIDILGYKDS